MMVADADVLIDCAIVAGPDDEGAGVSRVLISAPRVGVTGLGCRGGCGSCRRVRPGTSGLRHHSPERSPKSCGRDSGVPLRSVASPAQYPRYVQAVESYLSKTGA